MVHYVQCYATRLSIGRISNRRSRSYSVARRSSYLPDGKHTMYRRAHSCHQAASSRNIDFGPLFHPHKERGIRDHRRERWRDPSVEGVVSPRRQRNDRWRISLFWGFKQHTSRGLMNKVAKSNEYIERYHKIESTSVTH